MTQWLVAVGLVLVLGVSAVGVAEAHCGRCHSKRCLTLGR